ncbi:hypothetical protein NR996_00500 [Lactobacillus rodentium]|uniref:Uncharacterized protein n=1 Tax=Lactobacillus rodentium TaxID=947835 RepID=A0A2Z6T958_9LACO|nr:hypothetical protein [Lactobacillus rodentium]MCR1893891.1 hypothetical protein [Lactobacillus rodentium]GBG04243.1 hypothetical protein LrDSM24759_01570 [Lactobacillus rodentium]
MKTSFWTALIVLLVGLWDIQLAVKRWPKKDQEKTDGSASRGYIAFLILGVIFVITGIVLFFTK